MKKRGKVYAGANIVRRIEVRDRPVVVALSSGDRRAVVQVGDERFTMNANELSALADAAIEVCWALNATFNMPDEYGHRVIARAGLPGNDTLAWLRRVAAELRRASHGTHNRGRQRFADRARFTDALCSHLDDTEDPRGVGHVGNG